MDTVFIIIVLAFSIFAIKEFTYIFSASGPKEYLINDGLKEIDNSFQNKMNQTWEDIKVENHIRKEAYNKYRVYVEKKDSGFPTDGLYIGNYLGVYTIYDEKTAKYKDGNINKIIDEEYNKLIEKYELES